MHLPILLQISPKMEIKSVVAEVLGVPLEGWNIIDYDSASGLALIHYLENADLTQCGNLHGPIVDVQNRKLVCSSFDYTPTVVTSQLQHYEGRLNLFDLDCHMHHVDKYRLTYGFEGVIIRCFKHKGVVYRSTHKRLDPSRSRWGSSISFLAMYWALEGPTDEQLFSEEEDSPWCYCFLVVHSDLLTASKQKMRENDTADRADRASGFLVFLGCKDMSGRGQTADLRFPISDDINLKQKEIYRPRDLSLSEANHHLSQGFSLDYTEPADVRLGNGEFVILHKLDDQGKTVGHIKVMSPAYHWRAKVMREDDHNAWHAFFSHIGYASLPLEELAVHVPLLLPQAEVEIPFTSDKLIVADLHNPLHREMLSSPMSKLNCIWQAFLYSCPLLLQESVKEYLTRLLSSREELISWYFDLHNNDIPSDIEKELQPRALKIIRSYRSRKTDNSVIRSIVEIERGPSLYKLIRNMNHIKQVIEAEKCEKIKE